MHKLLEKPVLYSLALLFCSSWLSSASVGISINHVDIAPTHFMQGDKFNITINFADMTDLNNLTVSYVIVDNHGDDVAYLESDFFEVTANEDQVKTVEFKWTDFTSTRVGTLTLSTASIKQYSTDMTSSIIKATKTVNERFTVGEVKDQVLKEFISRENSLWWLTKMGWVNSPMVCDNDLDYCVMYGGPVTGELTNEEFYTNGSHILCYWEITGYAVRTLALEYERTGNTKYRDLATHMADTIIKNLNDSSIHPENNGTMHTQDYYNGVENKEYKNISVIFDHAQVQMGLLELARVMENNGDLGHEIYQNAGKRVGDFLYLVYKNNLNGLPLQWNRNTLTTSGVSPDPKAVIGMRYLYTNTRDVRYRDMAKNELDRHLPNTPTPGSDYHGQSYFAYGMIKGFEWFGDKAYLKKAARFAASVSSDMDSEGKLANEEYSRIPAQSQIIRNNALIWKYTGDDRFLTWADKSTDYLTNTDAVWMYNQPVLKLGRYYRESGGQYNCYGEPQLTSWGTEFHIDAFYHYLHQRYGDIYVDEDSHRVISMISTPKVVFSPDEIKIRVNGASDGVGIYVSSSKNIEAVFLDGEPTYYFSDHTARTPSYEGNKTITILLGEAKTPHIIRTNSIVTKTVLSSSTKFSIVLNGMKNTTGIMDVYWGAGKPTVKLNGTPLTEDVDWTWSSSDSIVRIHYTHDGNERNITLELSQGGQGTHS